MHNPQLTDDGKLKHLLSIEGLPKKILNQILDTAESFVGVAEREVGGGVRPPPRRVAGGPQPAGGAVLCVLRAAARQPPRPGLAAARLFQELQIPAGRLEAGPRRQRAPQLHHDIRCVRLGGKHMQLVDHRADLLAAGDDVRVRCFHLQRRSHPPMRDRAHVMALNVEELAQLRISSDRARRLLEGDVGDLLRWRDQDELCLRPPVDDKRLDHDGRGTPGLRVRLQKQAGRLLQLLDQRQRRIHRVANQAVARRIDANFLDIVNYAAFAMIQMDQEKG